MATIVATCFLVTGITDDDAAKAALQPLFDIFAEHGLGQATFEIVPGEPTRLWVKHKDTVTPDRELIGRALAKAGPYAVVGVGR